MDGGKFLTLGLLVLLILNPLAGPFRGNNTALQTSQTARTDFTSAAMPPSLAAAYAPGAPATPQASSGAVIFQQICSACHGPQGDGTQKAPSLHAVTNTGFVIQTVTHGLDGMPSYASALSSGQISAVAGYVMSSIATTSLSRANVSRGGVLYRLNCAGCHGATARGGALVGTGGNAPALTGLSSSQIAAAIRGGPGPMPVFPPDVISQHDMVSIASYVRLLQQPPHPGGVSLGYRGPVTEGMASLGGLGVIVLLAFWIERRGRG